MISKTNSDPIQKIISTKDINKRNILRIIKNNSPISRTEIATRLRISKTTISTYINELIDDGLIVENGFGDSTLRGGKKPTLLSFNNHAKYILCTEIGVSNIRTAITDLDSNIIKQKVIPTEEWLGPDIVIGKVINSLEDVLDQSQIAHKDILGIGISVPGLVSTDNKIAVFCNRLTGWSNIHLGEILYKKFKLFVHIENECRIGAIAEKYFGKAKNYNNFVSVIMGEGVGSGIFVDGKLYIGSHKISGEFGHTTVDDKGEKCHCGNVGCLTTIASTNTLKATIEKIVSDNPSSLLHHKMINSKNLDIEDIYDAFHKGDRYVEKEVLRNAYWVGLGIANLVKVLDPEIIIISGNAVNFGEKYLNVVIKTVEDKAFPVVSKNKFKIVFSDLGESIRIKGASIMIFDRVFGFSNYDLSKEFIVK
ncbi:MAG: ROK family transcriptional regulator [Actinobacteria bacterium]|nr:ROK family transcriptional regulator [Actinomycetota bacterium]